MISNVTKKDGSFELSFPSCLEEARRIQEALEAELRAKGYDERDLFGIKLSLEEALVNAIKHGNAMNRDKKVHLIGRITDHRFEIGIRDEGPGFDPEDVPDPLACENLERPSGRGLLLMRHYMCEVEIHPPGNHVTLCKHRASGDARGSGNTNGHSNGHGALNGNALNGNSVNGNGQTNGHHVE